MNDVSLIHYLILSSLVFSIGLFGVIAKKNVVAILFSIELMLNAVNINLVAFNKYLPNEFVSGQVFAVFVMVVAASEIAIGLAIAIALFNGKGNLSVEDYKELRR